MGYDRLYRRGHGNVQMEIYLVAMGHNIRKYQKLKKRIKETEEKTDETGQGDAQIVYLLIKIFLGNGQFFLSASEI